VREDGSPAGTAEAGVEIGDAFAHVLAETTQSLVCVLDGAGRILFFNAACERVTGYPRDEVLGRDAREVVIPKDEAAAFGEWLAGIWATGHPSPQIGHWLTRDGGRILVAWSNKPVPGDDGTPAYLVTTGIDVTEHERTKEERAALEGDLHAKLAEIGLLAREQAALRRVATLVASEAPPERVFEAVSEECARVLGAGAAGVFRYEADGTATAVGRFDREGIGVFELGVSVPVEGNSAIGSVRASGRPARIDDYENRSGRVAELMRSAGIRCAVAAPINVAGAVWGTVAVTTQQPEQLPPESEARLGAFAELVSLAVASAHAREELRASRARIVHTADTERRRLERNLHDGAQQRLVALGIAVRLARANLLKNPPAAEPLLESAIGDLEEAMAELRELARGLHPAILSERGLEPALTGLVNRAPLDVELVDAPDGRLPEAVEVAAYFIVAEALTNVAKHAQASQSTVSVRREGASAIVEVVDDGRGGATESGSGLLGVRDRAEALGGLLTVESPPGGGTTVRAVLPAGPPDSPPE
jgi:PAS domain S-box-containing protein